MPAKKPKKVETKAESWIVPLAAGGLVGFAGYHLAKTNPEIYGVGIGIGIAYLIMR